MIRRDSYILITGGAGFIGTNLASRLAEQGHPVAIFDNLSRPGVESNLEWLLNAYPEKIRFLRGDIRDAKAVAEAVGQASSVFHLAAQVAVTTSLVDPVMDFEVNARGTLHVLEAARAMKEPPFLLYTSTNKVLGGMEQLALRETDTRYEPSDPAIRARGIGEQWGIEFCSPYGCSKGAADQYVLDYSRCYGIPAVVFRMSCIYGFHQCGNEDQGWVAHFVKQTLAGEPITFYGDGRQVRDALFIEDLIEAFMMARERITLTSGHAFNIGGGPDNITSLVELVRLIGRIHGKMPQVRRESWRQSDQRYYVSDNSKFARMTGWRPRTPIDEGLQKLYQWLEGASRSAGAA